jgi:1-acyl-sn-glycerol-3-phosphate acyltransferase
MTDPHHVVPRVEVPRGSRAATGRNLASMASRAYSLHVEGAELVPRSGPVILASNHIGLLDGMSLAAASPRPVHVLSGAEMFVGPLAPLLRGTGQISLDSTRPDRTALLQALGVLRTGGAVAIFPEPERGLGDVARARPALAYLALRSGATVVPVCVLGTRPPGSPRDALATVRSRIDVVFGPAVAVTSQGDRHRRAVLTDVAERLRQVLADHVQHTLATTGRTLPGPPVRSGDPR